MCEPSNTSEDSSCNPDHGIELILSHYPAGHDGTPPLFDHEM
jgi:hypothetical protein